MTELDYAYELLAIAEKHLLKADADLSTMGAIESPWYEYVGESGVRSKPLQVVGGEQPETCVSHKPVQHRDGKPPWCRKCGRTVLFEVPTSRLDSAIDSNGDSLCPDCGIQMVHVGTQDGNAGYDHCWACRTELLLDAIRDVRGYYGPGEASYITRILDRVLAVGQERLSSDTAV